MTDYTYSDLCTCGCERIWHVEDVDETTKQPFCYCTNCFSPNKYGNAFPHPGFHIFKLDNLSLIEHEAKKRNLI